jgi:hypothetical protein
MKFEELYNKVAPLYIKEQEEQTAPMQVSDEISSQLPTPDTVDLNEEKYKTLLLALKKALEVAAKDDLEKRKVVSDINIDADPKAAEEQLISILNTDSSEFPQSQ